MTVVLEGMSTAQEQGWLVLLNLQIPGRAASCSMSWPPRGSVSA